MDAANKHPRWWRVVVTGTSPRIRRFYRARRAEGFSRDDAAQMTMGAVLISGEGRVSKQRIPEGKEHDARGRAEGMKTVGDLLRARNQRYSVGA